MFTHKKKRQLINTTCDWMLDIKNRLGNTLAWPLTSQHREFIKLLEDDDGSITFEEWKGHSIMLMNAHSTARNDIYDLFTVDVKIDADGHEQSEWETVSRFEKDVRSLLYIYRTEYGDEEE